MAKKSLTEGFTINLYISRDGGPERRWETLSAAEQADAGRRMAERMTQALRDYWARHPDEYAAYLKAHEADGAGEEVNACNTG